MTRRFLVSLAPLLALALLGCGPSTVSPTPSVAPVIVTFEVSGDERYRVLLTDPADVEVARTLLAGGDAAGIPDGRIVHVTGVNAGYSWSIDPSDIRFTDETDEDCDGAPSDVESGDITGDRYCPSDAVVVAIDEVAEPAPSGPSGT
jgi:hypothetical protein